jgi:hypothetical protein
MPYVFTKVVPADTRKITVLSDVPVYSKDITSLNTKLGCRLTPFNFFSVDVWYERTDIREKETWTLNNGIFSVNFGIKNYL